jgi:hypothetical protein
MRSSSKRNSDLQSMRASTEEFVNGISRWENEGGALRSEWIAKRGSSRRERETEVSAEMANGRHNPARPSDLAERDQ